MIPPSNPEKPPLKSAKRSIVVDMSQAAMERRLRQAFDLWEFWRYLRRFRPSEKERQASTESPNAMRDL